MTPRRRQPRRVAPLPLGAGLRRGAVTITLIFTLSLLFGLTLVAAGCGSSHPSSAVATGHGTTSAAPPPSPATTRPTGPLTPTVPDCGGGAYEPKTLLIVCGTVTGGTGPGTTMATNVSWASWSQSGASGAGIVNLRVGGQSVTTPARLDLSTVVTGAMGPQFSLLTVTWTGRSPDGRLVDVYHLQPGA